MLTKQIFHESLTLVILIVFFFLPPMEPNSAIIWVCLFIFYYYFYSSFKSSVSIVPGIPSFFKIDLFFLLFYYLLLYYPYQTYVFGSNSIKENSWVAQSYFQYSNKAIIASTIGLISFMMGFRRKVSITIKKQSVREYSQYQYLLLYICILLVTIFLFILFYLKGGMVMLSGAYLGSRTKDAAIDGIYTLLSVFVSVLAGFTILFYKKYGSLNVYMLIFLIIFAAYSYLTLVGGDRNTFFIIAIAFAGAYYSYIKPINRLLLVSYIFLALGIYQVIEISRMAEDRSLTTILRVISGDIEIRATSKLDANVDEGSFSITNLVTRAVFHFVPEKENFFLGKFKVIGFAGIIPYARGAIIAPNDPIQSSARYISAVNRSGFGLGSSIIMDSYIEFGLFGVFIFLYLLGWLGKYIQSRAQKDTLSIKWGVIYLLALGTYAELPRYTFDFIVKNIGWAVLIFFVFEKLFKPRGGFKTLVNK